MWRNRAGRGWLRNWSGSGCVLTGEQPKSKKKEKKKDADDVVNGVSAHTEIQTLVYLPCNTFRVTYPAVKARRVCLISCVAFASHADFEF